MTNYEIEAFQAIMNYGSISKAAEYLYISQPALSLRIRNLENELGCELFIRRKGIRNIELTDAGKRFVQLADRWNSFWTEVHTLPTSQGIAPFRVSSLNSISCALLPHVFSSFIKTHPDISLQTEDLASLASFDAIESKLIDFALIVDKRYSIQAISKPLFTEPLYLICNADSKLPDIVAPSDLDPHHELYSPWFLEFEQWHRLWFGRDAKPHIQVQILHLLRYFLQTPNAWSIVPASLYEMLRPLPNIVQKPMTIEIPNRTTSYLIPEGPKSLHTESFLKCLYEELALAEKRGVLTLL